MTTPHVALLTYVWPEPKSSAAGVRDIQLLRLFSEAKWKRTILSGCRMNSAAEDLIRNGADLISISANDSRFDSQIRDLSPDFVIFDRFVMEEQFGWRVREASPQAVRVLDTQDLHFLRRTRARALQGGHSDWNHGDTLRELSAIYRSDLTLLLSDFETDLLQNEFSVPPELLELVPFLYPNAEEIPEDFDERAGFAFIGNFRHPPNLDCVFHLKKEIWPKIKSIFPSAEVFIYGAYPPKEIMVENNPSIGFHVVGPVEDAEAALKKHRVSLAPLRYGAGIKGKIAESWRAGLPVAATAVAAEGMEYGLPWGGAIADSLDSFASSAVRLYQDRQSWQKARRNGYFILNTCFNLKNYSEPFLKRLLNLRSTLDERRKRNWTGSMLWHHSARSTEYFSRWIELKNQRVCL